jgi:hypothetical protein
LSPASSATSSCRRRRGRSPAYLTWSTGRKTLYSADHFILSRLKEPRLTCLSESVQGLLLYAGNGTLSLVHSTTEVFSFLDIYSVVGTSDAA